LWDARCDSAVARRIEEGKALGRGRKLVEKAEEARGHGVVTALPLTLPLPSAG